MSRIPAGSSSKKQHASHEEWDNESIRAVDIQVGAFVGCNDGIASLDDHGNYLRHMLHRKTANDAMLKSMQKKQGAVVKVEKLAVLEKEMMATTRKIVGKWHRKGKWVFYPTRKVCKTQRKSMEAAGVTHDSEFAKDICEDFMKHNWPDMENWEENKLWMGELKVFQLGKQALMALKDARNMCTQRVVATVDQFIVVPLANKNLTETKKVKLKALHKFATSGRKDTDALKTCLPLLAAFCLQKEKVSTASHRAASNWTTGEKM